MWCCTNQRLNHFSHVLVYTRRAIETARIHTIASTTRQSYRIAQSFGWWKLQVYSDVRTGYGGVALWGWILSVYSNRRRLIYTNLNHNTTNHILLFTTCRTPARYMLSCKISPYFHIPQIQLARWYSGNRRQISKRSAPNIIRDSHRTVSSTKSERSYCCRWFRSHIIHFTEGNNNRYSNSFTALFTIQVYRKRCD